MNHFKLYQRLMRLKQPINDQAISLLTTGSNKLLLEGRKSILDTDTDANKEVYIQVYRDIK